MPDIDEVLNNPTARIVDIEKLTENKVHFYCTIQNKKTDYWDNPDCSYNAFSKTLSRTYEETSSKSFDIPIEIFNNLK